MTISIWVGPPRSYTPGRNRAPQFVVLHGTAGSEGPNSAENGAAYDKVRTDGTSTHYFTDSLGPALQEVAEGDRAHAALFRGNEIGIQIEICGTVQTREQWLDPVSYATLVTTAALVRDICERNGFDLRLLTVAETRAAYYAATGQRPTGITDHSRVTHAFPEDGGTHEDMWPGFPWDVFMDLVTGGDMPTPEEYAAAVLGATLDVYELDENGVAQKTGETTLAASLAFANCAAWSASNALLVANPDRPPKPPQRVLKVAGTGGSGPTFDTLVEAARQGANQAEDT